MEFEPEISDYNEDYWFIQEAIDEEPFSMLYWEEVLDRLKKILEKADIEASKAEKVLQEMGKIND